MLISEARKVNDARKLSRTEHFLTRVDAKREGLLFRTLRLFPGGSACNSDAILCSLRKIRESS